MASERESGDLPGDYADRVQHLIPAEALRQQCLGVPQDVVHEIEIGTAPDPHNLGLGKPTWVMPAQAKLVDGYIDPTPVFVHPLLLEWLVGRLGDLAWYVNTSQRSDVDLSEYVQTLMLQVMRGPADWGFDCRILRAPKIEANPTTTAPRPPSCGAGPI